MESTDQITKNQHYVPRLYLKHFSHIKNEGTKKEKNLVAFFQFSGKLTREMISTKDICSEDYFYGEDGKNESMLSRKESLWANSIKKITIGEVYDSNDDENIREFFIYQIVRTKAMLDYAQDMANKVLIDGIHNEHKSIEMEEIKSIVQEKTEAELTPEYNLELAKDVLPIIKDLQFKVLQNKTGVNFITSDDPLIVINPFTTRNAGLGDIGTVMFLPISTQIMIMLYDQHFWGDVISEIYDESLIHAFNNYQYVNADERIIGLDACDFSDLMDNSVLQLKREEFHKSTKTKTYDSGEGTFIEVHSKHMSYYFDLPIFRLPNLLRKIPQSFRQSCSRVYSHPTRMSLVYQIYLDTNRIRNYDERMMWREKQKYMKKLLDHFDRYWQTPKEDLFISSELIRQIKAMPFEHYSFNNSQQEGLCSIERL